MDDDKQISAFQADLRWFWALAGFLLGIIIVSTIFFHIVEHFAWLDAYYFTIVTMATVGYGDFVPKTPEGKVAATVLIMIGIGSFGAFANLLLKRRAIKRIERSRRKR